MKTIEKKGLFITIEGLDGSGKTTQIKYIEELLLLRGVEVLTTREPGGTLLGEQLRSIILNPENIDITPLAEAFLYASARAQIVKTIIIPALDQGKFVICDRFVDSSIAYQGYGRQLGKMVGEINKHATCGLVPDLTFLLMLEPENGLKRIDDEGIAKDRIENESVEFHNRVLAGYSAIAEAEPKRVHMINARLSICEINNIIKNKIEEKLKEVGF